jgi:2',3'-cyclic-nucleotide 2'-phosphodiesterase/3'-nucleotidase
VDVTKPVGQRVLIESLADGTSFDEASEYNVAMTSYRASGGGGLMTAAGVDTERINDRVVEYYPEIRNILYDYLLKNKVIDTAHTGDRTVIGEWRFIPEDLASKALGKDMELLFPAP